jgi:hypothetical protein
MGHGNSVVRRAFRNKLFAFLSTDGHLDADNSFRRVSPGGQHNFIAAGDILGSGVDDANDNVGCNDKQEVDDERLLLEDSVEDPSAGECERKEVHR